MRAYDFMRRKNEVQLLRVILYLGIKSIFENIYREAGFLKARNAKKLSRSTLCRYLRSLEDKGYIRRVDKRWLLTEVGYKALVKIQRINVRPSIIVHTQSEGFVDESNESRDIKLI